MLQHLIVPVDGSSIADRGLAMALRLARELRLTPKVVVLHVLELPLPVTEAGIGYETADLQRALRQQGESLLERARGLCQAAGVVAGTELREATGRVADVVVERVHERGCDLVAMGTHGRRAREPRAPEPDCAARWTRAMPRR